MTAFIHGHLLSAKRLLAHAGCAVCDLLAEDLRVSLPA